MARRRDSSEAFLELVRQYRRPGVLDHEVFPHEEAAMTTLKDILKQRTADEERLRKEAPALSEGFHGLMAKYYSPSTLDRKYKELMAVSASVATRCVPCLANHMTVAVSAGATRAEVIDAAAIGVEFGGGPAFTVVREHLLPFLDEITSNQ